MTFPSSQKSPIIDLSASRISSFDSELWPVDHDFKAGRTQLSDGRFSVPTVRLDSPTVLNWAELRNDPKRLFQLEESQQTLFTLTPDGQVSHQLDLDALFIRRSPHKLLVVLHGALDRAKYALPRLEYMRTLKGFDGSILFVQDPTLYVHEHLTLGWYIGTERDNGHALVEHLIREAIGVLEPSQILIAGSSGGGFASLAISARIPESSALVFSPQTSVEKYNIGHRRRFISSAFPSLTPNLENLMVLEDRIDMGALYSKGTSNQVYYLQNTGDPFHIKNHCIPFMQHVGLNVLDGEFRNKRIKVEFRFLSEGHNAPRPNQWSLYVNRIFDGGF